MLRTLNDAHHMPALDPRALQSDLATRLDLEAAPPPRVLLLYGSLRPVSYSRLLTEEAARLLLYFGCDVRIFDPSGLPQPDSPAAEGHPEVEELRALSLWSEAQVWCSPERHGAITAVLKNQIDHIPLSLGAVRPTQGRTLAVMQVSGGSQSFNAVNTLRLLGRWMRMITIPNQSSVESLCAGSRSLRWPRKGRSARNDRRDVLAVHEEGGTPQCALSGASPPGCCPGSAHSSLLVGHLGPPNSFLAASPGQTLGDNAGIGRTRTGSEAWQEFDEQGRMKPSAYYDRVVDVMEELVKFTLLTRRHSDALVDRYSERREVLRKAATDATRLARDSGAVA